MFLMWLAPVALVFLVVYALNGNNLSNQPKPVVGRTCQACGEEAQNDWKICPRCGQEL